MSRRVIQRKRTRKLAKTRIEILWNQAKEIANTRPELAKRWMILARRIAQKARIKVPLHMNRYLCKNCGAFLVPGRNCRVRIRNNRSRHVTITCLECNTIRRYPVTRQG